MTRAPSVIRQKLHHILRLRSFQDERGANTSVVHQRDLATGNSITNALMMKPSLFHPDLSILYKKSDEVLLVFFFFIVKPYLVPRVTIF